MADNDLSRFHDAQADMYDTALDELRRGMKRGHWMWYIFPQIAGLGRSHTATFYALADRGEAAAYLVDPVLGVRLRQAATVLLTHTGRSIVSIMGDIDAVKLRSSMTLFETVGDDDTEPFAAVLDTFFDGTRDRATLSLIR